MYEAVHAYPDGESTVARFARTADRYGFDGLVVRTRESEYDPEAVRSRYGVDVVDGVEVVADNPESASGSVGNFRRKYTALLVRGGTSALNRFAVEQDRVDVLARPFSDDGDVNHVVAKAAREHGVRIEFDFGPALRTTGGRRVQHLRKLRKLRELVEQYDAPYVVSANADSHLRLRAPRELLALGEVIGFDDDAVETGLREWGRLAERNRKRRSESFIEPGVERGRYEE